MVVIPWFFLLGCTDPASLGPPGPNIMVVLTDDIGADKTGSWGPHPYPTYTPTVDALAEEGIRFTNVYVNPTCSPTRATLMTGRHATRTGIGRWIYPNSERHSLPDSEITLAEMLAEAPVPYTSAAVGKWHLSGFVGVRAEEQPMEQGFEYHRGSLANPKDASQTGETRRGYTNWEKNVDGELEWSTTYMTTDTIDEAIAMVETLPEPWFLWVAVNAAHSPWHVPPDALNVLGVTEESPDEDLYDADVMAFDLELARLLSSIDPTTRDEMLLVYLADNGSPGEVVRDPFDEDRGKGTLFEGGVRVPMVVSGPAVRTPGSSTDALVSATDLFPTLAELAGVDLEKLNRRRGVNLDGHSFLSALDEPDDFQPREVLFSESFRPNGPRDFSLRERVVRSATHKLIQTETAEEATTRRFYRVYGGEVDEGGEVEAADYEPGEGDERQRLEAALDALAADLELDD